MGFCMSKKLTTKEFIERARVSHGDRYGYSKVEYISNKNNVTIGCRLHGDFEQSPANHIKGHGCPKCAADENGLKKSSNISKFIEKAIAMHGELYDYCNAIYKGSNINLEIICKQHGSFLQMPSNHLKGKGCPKCGRESIREKNSSSIDEFIEKARKKHGDKYDYSKVEYTNAKNKVEIICKKHNEFYQTPSDHLGGCGCPECGSDRKSPVTRSGFSESVSRNNGFGTLYLIRCSNENESFFKIGITGKDVSDRFGKKSDMPYYYEVISEVTSNDSDFIYDTEVKLKRMLKDHKYSPSIYFGGHTECFELSKLPDVVKFFKDQQ